MVARRIVTGLLTVAALGLAWRLFFPPEPPNPQRILAEALTSIERGDLRQLEDTRKALEQSGDTASYLKLLDAAVAVHHRRADEALGRIAQVKPEGALRRPSMLYAARALHQINRLVEAEVLLRALAREHPGDPEVLRWLGVVLYDLGAFDAATPVLAQLAALEPDDYRPLRLQGLMYLDFEEYGKAIPAYRGALARNPPPAARDEILVELGRALIANRQYEEALEPLRQASRSARAEALIARCYLNLGDLDQTRGHLQAARDLDPRERDSRLIAAELLESEGKYEEAHNMLQQLVEESPYDVTARYRFALLLQRQRRTAEAEEQLAIWTKLQKAMTRLVELNQSAVMRPRDGAVRDELATVCESLGKQELAVMWRKAAMACRVEPNAAPDVSADPK